MAEAEAEALCIDLSIFLQIFMFITNLHAGDNPWRMASLFPVTLAFGHSFEHLSEARITLFPFSLYNL